MARARTLEVSGFGTGSIETTVELNCQHSLLNRPYTTVLAFHDGPYVPDGHSVEMKWLNPEHLELVLKGHRTYDTRVVRCAGIDISVTEIPCCDSSSSSQ